MIPNVIILLNVLLFVDFTYSDETDARKLKEFYEDEILKYGKHDTYVSP